MVASTKVPAKRPKKAETRASASNTKAVPSSKDVPPKHIQDKATELLAFMPELLIHNLSQDQRFASGWFAEISCPSWGDVDQLEAELTSSAIKVGQVQKSQDRLIVEL